MKTILLKKWTAVSEIAHWLDDDTHSIEFTITKSSSFCFLAEQFALSAIVHLRRLGCALSVRRGATYGSEESELTNELPIFRTLFGIQLAYAANSIRDASGKDVTTVTRKLLWERILQNEGCIADGVTAVLVSREPDQPVPQCLLDAHTTSLPSQARFREVLDKLSGLMGLKDVFQIGGLFEAISSEAEISRILFEAFRNSYEHARESRDFQPHVAIWGVCVEKFIFNSSNDVLSRRHLPDVAKKYLGAIWRRTKSKNLRALAVTAMDCGPGIQNTLPTTVQKDPWLRLNRAFEPGVSRKPQSSGLNRGEGLPNITDACTQLRALLVVRSSGLCGLRNFYRNPTIHQSSTLLNRWYAQGGTAQGTAITVLWPITA
jgi:hypothetical protein